MSKDAGKTKSAHAELIQAAAKTKSDLEQAKSDLQAQTKAQTKKTAAQAAANEAKVSDLTSVIEMKDSNIKSLQEQVAHSTSLGENLTEEVSVFKKGKIETQEGQGSTQGRLESENIGEGLSESKA